MSDIVLTMIVLIKLLKDINVCFSFFYMMNILYIIKYLDYYYHLVGTGFPLVSYF